MIEVAPQFSFFTTPLFFGFERKKPYNNLESVSRKLSSTVMFKRTNLHRSCKYVIIREKEGGRGKTIASNISWKDIHPLASSKRVLEELYGFFITV